MNTDAAGQGPVCWPGFWSLFWVLAPSGPTSTTPPNPAAEASPSGITGLPSAWGAAGLAGTIAWVSSRSSFDLVRNCNCSGPSVGQTSGLPVGWASGPASRRQQGHVVRDSVNWQTSGPMPLGFQPMPFGYSLRGHCRTERRKDRWFCNPKGIVSSSPGLPSPRGYPGLAPVRFSTPTIVSPLRHRATTPLGLANTTRFSQRSSRLATLGFGAESLLDSREFPQVEFGHAKPAWCRLTATGLSWVASNSDFGLRVWHGPDRL